MSAEPRPFHVASSPPSGSIGLGTPLAGHLLVLTAAKLVANTALRWIGPFLPTLERAFGVSVGTLTTVMGLAELAGLSTAATGGLIDRGHHRRVFVTGLGLISASALIAVLGSIWWFALSFVLLILGLAHATVAGQAWVSARVSYDQRARAIGIFELSWALSLLLGALVIAGALQVGGWRAPFLLLALGCALAAVAVVRVVPRDEPIDGPTATGTHTTREPLGSRAWRILVSSALVAAAGLSVYVVAGAWLASEFGVSTAGLGLVAAGFGGLELVASGSTAVWVDRLGKRRAVLLGLVILGVGTGITSVAGSSLVSAVIGLTIFLAGFEFSFVSSLSLVSEAAPAARGRALGVANGVGTAGRAVAVTASGQLFDAVGIIGSLGLAAALGIAAAAILPAATPQMR